MHARLPAEVKEHNYSVWNETMGVTNEDTNLKFKVATNRKSSAHLKALGKLTNSLPINEVDADGRLIGQENDAEDADDAVRMFVTAAPTNIRDFCMSVALGDVTVVPHMQEPMQAVKDFDYKESSLKTYGKPIVVADVSAGKGGERERAKGKVGKAKGAGDETNLNPVIKAFCGKGPCAADAASRAMFRLLETLQKHQEQKGAWGELALIGNDQLYFEAMDLIQSGQGEHLPDWVCDKKANTNFVKLVTFRSTKMGSTPPGWNHAQRNSALEKWTVLCAGNKAGQALQTNAAPSDDEEEEQPPKRSRSMAPPRRTSRTQKKGGEEKNGREENNGKEGDTEMQQKLEKMESHLHELKEQNTAFQAALQQRPENPASNEQVTELKAKLDVAMTGLNHLVQHFHDSEEVNSSCMRGLVNILRTKFTQQEIGSVMKKTNMNDYLP